MQHANTYRHDLRRLFAKFNVQSVLDYGGGGTEWADQTVPEGQSLRDYLSVSKVINFEPSRGRDTVFASDAVVCFDVLEHIFLGDVAYVLEKIFSSAHKLVYIVVASYSAKKTLPNGDNAHITERSENWWRGALDMVAARYPDITYRLIVTRKNRSPIVFETVSFHGINSANAFTRQERMGHATDLERDIALLNRAARKIKDGQGDEANRILSNIAYSLLPPKYLKLHVHLSCVLGATGYAKSQDLRAVNALLPPDENSDIRYRAALRTRDIRTAKRLRKYLEDRDVNGHRSAGWSASVACLHSGKKRGGFCLYHNRIGATDGVVSWPKNARYIRFEGQVQTEHVHLEQGVGDIFFHLAHIKSAGIERGLRFHCTKRWGPILSSTFPECDAQIHDDWVEVPDDTPMHASADFMVSQYFKNGTIRPTVLLAEPKTNRKGFGFSWRGGGASLNQSDRRRIDLPLMLRTLPQNVDWCCLQYDIKQEELDLIKKLRPDVRYPKFNMRSDLFGVFELIRSLEGVVSVRNANLHMAGNTGIPTLALIEDTSSWLWSDDGSSVRSLYDMSTIHPIARFSKQLVSEWITGL